MPVYLNFVCEHNTKEERCVVLPVHFDELSETWGNIITTVTGWGWKIEGGPKQNTIRCWCPAHSVT